MDAKITKARDQPEIDQWDKSPTLNWATVAIPKRPEIVVFVNHFLDKAENLMRYVRASESIVTA